MIVILFALSLNLPSAYGITCTCSGSYRGFIEDTIRQIGTNIKYSQDVIDYYANLKKRAFPEKFILLELKPAKQELSRLIRLKQLAANLLNSCGIDNECTIADGECFGYEFGSARLIASYGKFQPFKDFKINRQQVQELVLGCGSRDLIYYGAGLGPAPQEKPQDTGILRDLSLGLEDQCQNFYLPWVHGGWRSQDELFSCAGDMFCSEDFKFKRFYTCSDEIMCNLHTVEGYCLPFLRKA